MSKCIHMLVVVAFLLCACTAPHHNSETASLRGITAGPVVKVDKAVLSRSREEACNLIENRKSTDLGRTALQAGIVPTEFEAIQRVTMRQRIITTFRDSNQACLPHLASGVQSKPHSVLQKTWDRSNLHPEDEGKAGLVSNLMKKPLKSEKIAEPKLTLLNGEPVTCDYDVMDLAEKNGERIVGESSRELEIRNDYNAAIPTTVQGHRDRIMHGSQAAYGQYIRLHDEESVISGLFKPEAPLTALDDSGAVFRLETLEQVLDFYRCKMISIPLEWQIEPDDSSK